MAKWVRTTVDGASRECGNRRYVGPHIFVDECDIEGYQPGDEVVVMPAGDAQAIETARQQGFREGVEALGNLIGASMLSKGRDLTGDEVRAEIRFLLGTRGGTEKIHVCRNCEGTGFIHCGAKDCGSDACLRCPECGWHGSGRWGVSDDVTKFGVCPRCGGGLHFQVNLFIDAPATRFGSLSKATLRSKDVQVLGAGWDRVSWYCPKGDWASRLAPHPQGDGQ